MANKSPNTPGGIPPQAITAVLVIFVLGWIASIGAEIFRSGYSAPAGLNEAMIAIVTAFFVAQQRISKPDKTERETPTPTPEQDEQP